MFYQLTEALKNRFILELRKYWQYHPKYRDDLVDHIQGKFSFKERPQYAIIVKTGSANRFNLSADNYVGVHYSYIFNAKAEGFPGVALEWVQEDAIAIQNNGGVFPSAPGVYYLELTEDTEFYVDCLLSIYAEQVTMLGSRTGMLDHAPVMGSLRLYEQPANYQLVEGSEYTLTLDGSGKPTGEINLNYDLLGGRVLKADYKTPGPSTGPHPLQPMYKNNTAIPGVSLAFGRRNEKGDRMVVVVDRIRQPAALVYGGKWDLAMDLDITSRDPYAQQEITDSTLMYLEAILRPYLSTEGIEISDLSGGGESEEPMDENGDDYYYNASISFTVQTDWKHLIPLTTMIRQVSALSSDQARLLAFLSDEDLALYQNNLVMLESLNLKMVDDPYFDGRATTFETIR